MTYTRHTALEDRHRALGAEPEEWNGMGMAWQYDQDVNDEHRAVRTAAGLFDVSGLKKVHILGPRCPGGRRSFDYPGYDQDPRRPVGVRHYSQ